jgi:hypothetical protein
MLFKTKLSWFLSSINTVMANAKKQPQPSSGYHSEVRLEWEMQASQDKIYYSRWFNQNLNGPLSNTNQILAWLNFYSMRDLLLSEVK